MAMAEHHFRGNVRELLMLKRNMTLSFLAVGKIEPRFVSDFANFPLDLHEKYGEIVLGKILFDNCRVRTFFLKLIFMLVLFILSC